MVDLFEDLEEAVIQYFHGIFLFAGITITDSHSIPVERAVQYLLALSFIKGAGLNMVGQFVRR